MALFVIFKNYVPKKESLRHTECAFSWSCNSSLPMWDKGLPGHGSTLWASPPLAREQHTEHQKHPVLHHLPAKAQTW